MQNAQDTFYITLRNRLAAVNPQRTIYLRGITRPAILVEGNELVTAQPPSDAFILRWTGMAKDSDLSLVLLKLECEIGYMTEGSAMNLGMDRGVFLAQLDSEMMSILEPHKARKMDYARTPAAALKTQLFWTQAAFQPVRAERDRLSRAAKVTVFSYEEPGEL